MPCARAATIILAGGATTRTPADRTTPKTAAIHGQDGARSSARRRGDYCDVNAGPRAALHAPVPADPADGGSRPSAAGCVGGQAEARLTRRLNAIGIHSILDLSRADPVMIRDRFSVVTTRTVLELQGTPCIPLEEERIGRDQLIFSRSFSTPITTSAELRQVLSVYAQQASSRLARHGLQAKILTAFAGTSEYNPQDKSFPSVCIRLPMPTADPVLLTRAAHGLLPAIQDGSKYVRAGIMVTDLRPTGIQKPLELFENLHEEGNIGPLVEEISRRYGRGAIGLGFAGLRSGVDWSMKRDMRSPRYTTHWDEMPVVRAA
ncbi:hypothetical protein SRABI83_04505 [Arthrobacter sp. Bi83]|nr:hypothetical protein SRABI83_04505 [Arthrobacter sp. Bi83]